MAQYHRPALMMNEECFAETSATSTRLHGITSQNVVVFLVTVVRRSNVRGFIGICVVSVQLILFIELYQCVQQRLTAQNLCTCHKVYTSFSSVMFVCNIFQRFEHPIIYNGTFFRVLFTRIPNYPTIIFLHNTPLTAAAAVFPYEG